MNKYYLEMRISETMNASSKAVNDCNKILNDNGFKPFVINMKKNGNKYIKKIHNGLEIYKIMKIPKESMIVIPHPLYLNKKYIDIFKNAKVKNKLKLVFLIHDLDSVRKMFINNQDDFEYMDKTMFEISDYIISHNQKMKDYIKNLGYDENKIINLEVFDYIAEEVKEKPECANVVNIAGNLDTTKCKYLSGLVSIDKSVSFQLFGVNYDEKNYDSELIVYKGCFPADEVPKQLTRGWGLVWDGEEIDGCTGSTGEYLRYNNPHKLSLYLASGMPVIIWKEAAEAGFVEKNRLGITVDSLRDIGERFKSISETEYNEIAANVMNISKKLHDGAFLTKAITTILEMQGAKDV